MKFLQKLDRFVFNYLRYYGLYDDMPDKAFIEKLWKRYFHSTINLDNPVTYNEKLQWLKLYDRNPMYTRMVDKYEAKKYVAEVLGNEDLIIPTYGVWNKFDDINFNLLPNQFVLKTTHDSGGVVICKDKKNFDISQAKKTLNHSLRYSYYKWAREWPYKDVEPRIIAESLLPLDNIENVEYKLFCFNGEVRVVLVCKGEAHKDGTGVRTNDFMDANFQRIPVTILNGHSKVTPKKPEQYDEMVEIATKLSHGIPQLRVDLYSIDGHIRFGEMTFFHNSGFNKLVPEKYNYEWGAWIQLPGEKSEK